MRKELEDPGDRESYFMGLLSALVCLANIPLAAVFALAAMMAD